MVCSIVQPRMINIHVKLNPRNALKRKRMTVRVHVKGKVIQKSDKGTRRTRNVCRVIRVRYRLSHALGPRYLIYCLVLLRLRGSRSCGNAFGGESAREIVRPRILHRAMSMFLTRNDGVCCRCCSGLQQGGGGKASAGAGYVLRWE